MLRYILPTNFYETSEQGEEDGKNVARQSQKLRPSNEKNISCRFSNGNK